MADLEKGTNPGNFTWMAPTTDVAGQPIVGTLSYRLYRRDDEQPHTPDDFFYMVVGSLQPDGAYMAPLDQFPEGRSVIALTAVDEDGDESAFSNTLGFTVSSAPNPPVLLD